MSQKNEKKQITKSKKKTKEETKEKEKVVEKVVEKEKIKKSPKKTNQPLLDKKSNTKTKENEKTEEKEKEKEKENQNEVTSFFSMRTTKQKHKTIELVKQKEQLPLPFKPVTKRDRVAIEILTTERTYLYNLDILINTIQFELKSKSKSKNAILTNSAIKKLFGNLPDIFRVNKQLSQGLEQKLKNWKKKSTLGTFFKDLIPFLKMYQNYVIQFQKSTELIQKLLRQNINFKKWSERNIENYGLHLQSFLIMPVQRLPRYELLLRELLDSTEENHEDFLPLSEAYEKITLVNKHVNEAVYKRENQKEIIKLQKKFNSSKLKDLITPSRLYIAKGPLMKISRKKSLERHFFLFSDLLIYATVSGTGYKLHNKFDLSNVRVEDVPDGDEIKNAFAIISEKKSFTVYAKTNEEKQKWLLGLTKVIEKNLEKSSTLNVKQKQIKQRAPIWIPDSMVIACIRCNKKFSTVRRRHHCRNCGKCVCGKCSSHKLLLSHISSKKVRVCNHCYKEILDQEEKN
ncbi:faciogenital dysplasia protein [Anaeramoeba flamelloides]|uniref:Faciogenital dysplasia protein n=1 Tax=Anaeramoeba flamelloides TaxID=1746091 RepID=A0AAV7ZIY2_9EUKA|nr:faciogenital dysplasia protein [Anaeramoeba flamelloides]